MKKIAQFLFKTLRLGRLGHLLVSVTGNKIRKKTLKSIYQKVFINQRSNKYLWIWWLIMSAQTECKNFAGFESQVQVVFEHLWLYNVLINRFQVWNVALQWFVLVLYIWLDLQNQNIHKLFTPLFSFG